MKYYMAPLEGVTTYVYRNAYHHYFTPMDKYFTPFIVPHKDKKFNTREIKELSPEHNKGLYVVPQLLTNNAEDFMKTAKDILEFGYEEINLNLGCPSGTVVAKKKGSGFLQYTEELDEFLDTIFQKADFKISIKTRIGKSDPEEFYRLMEIYNQYPLEELIIHPRVQTDFYKNKPNWDIFKDAVSLCKCPLCYNGDIFTKEDYERFKQEFPFVDTVMIGRGIIKGPGLLGEIEKGESLSIEQLEKFYDELYEGYKQISSGERNTLFKMKEMWSYMGGLFESPEKILKKIKKAQHLKDYDQAVERLFHECGLKK